MDLSDALNSEQQAVVRHPGGPLLVLAGAGSGKTRALTWRIAWLIAERGVHPGRILALTFTNRAARELRERVVSLCGDDARGLVAGPFHAFGARLLRRYAGRVGRTPGFTIYDDDDQVRLLTRLLPTLGLDTKRVAAREVRRAFERRRRSGGAGGAAPAGLDEGTFERLFERYRRELASADALDFSDLIELPAGLLQDAEDVRLRERARFRHVLVDEFQDTDRSQARLLDGLVDERGNLVVVGDDDQSIYGWRGADVGNILRFPEVWAGCAVVRLERNYRSTGSILAAADAVIAHNRERMGKRLIPVLEQGEPVRTSEHADGRDEARRVADRIAAAVAEGAEPGEFAVFYRVHAQSRPFEDALRALRLGYEIVGGTRFYDRAEVKDVLAYARLLLNRRDGVALMRILNVPPRGIGARTAARILAAATEEGGPWAGVLDVAAGASRMARAVARFIDLVGVLHAASEVQAPAELLRTILIETGYEARLRDAPDALERLANLEELLVAAGEYQRSTGEAGLAGFLELTALHGDVDSYAGSGRVTLMTLHAAKGLEFDTVFLTGLEEGLFPLRRGDDVDVEEERRLAYVGMTRARRRLHLTWARQRMLLGELRSEAPSRFLRELPRGVLQARVERQVQTTWRPRRRPQPNADADFVDARSDDWDHVDPVPDYDEPVRSLPAVGARVVHEALGEGTVVGSSGAGPKARLLVDFPVRGVRRILASYLTLLDG